MCDFGGAVTMTRRRMLVAGGIALAVHSTPIAPASAMATVDVAPGLPIVPRSEWGADLPVRGPLTAERRGDVRFLLVHHSASPNDYSQDATVGFLRSFYGLHTGEKGWPDVAYNFFVDRFGIVYEARTGSLERPVIGDATGGSQGFAQLCCFVGDHSVERPTLAAHTSMIRLLAWLADRYDIPTGPGSMTTFVSRGSNLHPAGTQVTTPTIAGHRDMSQTVCPGDAAYAMVRQDYQRAVTTRRTELVATTTTVPTTTTSPPSSTAAPTTTARPSTGRDGPSASSRSGESTLPLLPAGLGVGAAALAAGAVALRRRHRSPSTDEDAAP